MRLPAVASSRPHQPSARGWWRRSDLGGADERYHARAWPVGSGHSGDIVTLAVLDSLEIRDPYALLALTTDLTVTAHGPFDDRTVADSYAPRLATADPRVTGTCPVPLHHPDQPTMPDTAWVPMLPAIATRVTPAPAGAAPVALLLLDRNTGRHALVGPFPHHRAAQAWQPTPPAGPDIDRDVLSLHPAPPADLTGWLHP